MHLICTLLRQIRSWVYYLEHESLVNELKQQIKTFKKEQKQLKLTVDSTEEELNDIKLEKESLTKSLNDMKKKRKTEKEKFDEELEDLKNAHEVFILFLLIDSELFLTKINFSVLR